MSEAAIFGLVAGLCVGIIPVVFGATKEKLGLGIEGFFACALSGILLGLLLAVPICGVFIWLIVKNSTSSDSQIVITHKKCPYCAEAILIDAKFCKHCGREQ